MSKYNFTTLSIGLSLLTLSAHAGVPADYPKIKPGLWEIKSSLFGTEGKFTTIRQCMDAATIAQSEKSGEEYEKSANCKTTYQKRGATYISDSTCHDKTSGLLQTHTEVTQVNTNSIKSTATTLINGKPDKNMKDMINISTRLGDCEASTTKTEGMSDKNGNFVSFDDLIKQAQQAQHKK
jgi:hypothetical protein